VPSKAYEFL